MDYKDEWNRIGYNLEELYFEKVNRELIKKLKAKNLPVTQAQNQEMGKVLQFRAKAVKEDFHPPIKKAA